MAKLHNYTAKTDIWSLGTAYFELTVGVAPFASKDWDNFIDNI